ncbi:hypothetical protein [Streptomyces sp. NBC_00388]|uniref:hypothetical protein n=1 Tax=Streptomyces sp. NBC_00388 TaxID=2975735 RepID=UPI002E1AF69B
MAATHPLYSRLPIPVVAGTTRERRRHRARRSPTFVHRVRAAALLTMTGAAAATLLSVTVSPTSPPAADRSRPHSAPDMGGGPADAGGGHHRPAVRGGA